MKLSRTTVLVITLFFSHTLSAADARFCDGYAKTSIKQQMVNVVAECKQKGIRWSTLHKGQYRWCTTVRESVANKETKFRNDALAKCGVSINENLWDYPKYPSAQSWLYNSMANAVKKDDVVSVKYMHKEGVEFTDNAGDNDGGLLYLAVDHQAEKTAKYLLTKGQKPTQIPNGGGNALSKMIEDKKINYRMLAMLLKNGFDPNYGGEGYSDDYFPMMLAARLNKYRVMQMLLKAKGDPNLGRDQTTLIFAIKNRNMSIVKMLVNAGADVNKRGSYPDGHLSPLDIAQKSGSGGMVKYLKSKGAKCAFCKP